MISVDYSISFLSYIWIFMVISNEMMWAICSRGLTFINISSLLKRTSLLCNRVKFFQSKFLPKWLFRESRNSHRKNTCVWVSLLNWDSNTGVYLKNSRNFQEHLFEEHLPTAASRKNLSQLAALILLYLISQNGSIDFLCWTSTVNWIYDRASL